MNSNTLRFGVVRALAFGGLLVAGAWAGEAATDLPAPSHDAEVATLWTEVQATLKVELAVELRQSVNAELQRSLVRELDTVDAATRNDLMTKAAAAASVAPRGFGLVSPALIVDLTQ